MDYFTPNLRKFSLFIDLKMKSGARKSTWSKEVQSVIQALLEVTGSINTQQFDRVEVEGSDSHVIPLFLIYLKILIFYFSTLN